MMKKKYIGAALACALAMGAWSGAALAGSITVGGVNWDPDYALDLNIGSATLFETPITGTGQTLTGYGNVANINGNADFCSGCNLTFKFTYTSSYLSPTVNNSAQAIFTSGVVNFFVSTSPPKFDPTDPSSATLGTPWLTLTGHTGMLGGFPVGMTGQLFSNINGTSAANPVAGSNGFGYLDATGGMAAPYMQTHLQPDGNGGFADFSINSQFLFQLAKGCTGISSDLTNICAYPINGGATLTGASTVPVKVPEPGPIGLLGVGLAVLGLFMRRRRNEAEGRA